MFGCYYWLVSFGCSYLGYTSVASILVAIRFLFFVAILSFPCVTATSRLAATPLLIFVCVFMVRSSYSYALFAVLVLLFCMGAFSLSFSQMLKSAVALSLAWTSARNILGDRLCIQTSLE